MKTFKEIDELQNKIHKMSLEQNANNSIAERDMSIWDFVISKDTRQFVQNTISNTAEDLYFSVWKIIRHLPRSLQIEWIKKEIFELNKKLSEEISPRPEFDQETLKGKFLESFIFYNSMNSTEEELSESEKAIKEFNNNINYEQDTINTFELRAPKMFEVSKKPEDENIFHGEVNLGELCIIKGENWTVFKSLKEIEEYIPKFGKITGELALLLHYENLVVGYEELERGGEMPAPKIKQPLTFIELFKPEYRTRVNELFDILKQNGYIDQNNDWIFKANTNEPAKLFHYLKDNGVIYLSTFKSAIECFYKEFNCEVAEKETKNYRATTRKNAAEAKNSVDEKEFDRFLLRWISNK